MDLFGNGVASPEAIAYIQSSARDGLDAMTSVLKESVASASMQGKLPFGLRAGPVATAFGVQYRSEVGDQLASPLAASHKHFPIGNFSPFSGKYNVKEAFVEVNAPLLKNQGIRALNVDAAVRGTDYSTSGFVDTYKFGLTGKLTGAIGFRAAYSRDIRAPDLQELFNPGVYINSGIQTNPYTHQPTPNVFGLTGAGNPNLVPEKGTTKTLGIVLTPIPNLDASLDYYTISISDAIATFGSQITIAKCEQGVAAFCDNLVFNGPGGALSEIIQRYINANVQQTSGLDLSADYSVPFLKGNVALHGVGNYTFSNKQTALGVTTDSSNCLGDSCQAQGEPKFKGTASGTYSQGPWSLTLEGRFIGAAELNTAWVQGVDVDDNDIPFTSYLDLRASGSGDPSWFPPYDTGDYDPYGAVYRIGVRARF